MAEPTRSIVLENSSDQDEKDLARKRVLLSSTEMAPVQGTVDVDVPVSVLWEAFTHANWWPRWNKCFFWARNRDLVLGKKLIWAFEPIRWWYLYKMFATANIVELKKDQKVTWEVTAMPGFYARHTYHMEDLGDGRTRFGSWEQAHGAQIRFTLTRKFWVAHFTFVRDRSVEGAKYLEQVYRREGLITGDRLKRKRYWTFWLAIILLLLVLSAGGIGLWFYYAYLRPTQIELAPGVSAILAGGGNSLVVKDGNDLLVVDTKFPPASDWLRKTITEKIGSPVTMVINTHYHYDHTEGNTNYPGARVYAYKTVPDLLKIKRDADWWNAHQSGIPNQKIDGTANLQLGAQEIVVIHPGPAHTQGDLWVYLRRGDKEIVATGDLFMHNYYPFMDLGEGGTDLPGLIAAVRTMANRYPNADFLPGHGPIAKAGDLIHYADYLQFLYDSVAQARQKGFTEDQTVSSIDVSKWTLSKLPSFYGGKLCWASAETNIRWVYQMQTGTRIAREDCTF
jgi:glyoxylase-like metal-dependent hydrolase (beta-lactamase superfamily II)